MPCGIAAGTPQSFPQPPWQLMPTTSGVPHPNQQVGCAPLPAQIHQISSWRRIKGVTHAGSSRTRLRPASQTRTIWHHSLTAHARPAPRRCVPRA